MTLARRGLEGQHKPLQVLLVALKGSFTGERKGEAGFYGAGAQLLLGLRKWLKASACAALW